MPAVKPNQLVGVESLGVLVNKVLALEPTRAKVGISEYTTTGNNRNFHINYYANDMDENENGVLVLEKPTRPEEILRYVKANLSGGYNVLNVERSEVPHRKQGFLYLPLLRKTIPPT